MDDERPFVTKWVQIPGPEWDAASTAQLNPGQGVPGGFVRGFRLLLPGAIRIPSDRAV